MISPVRAAPATQVTKRRSDDVTKGKQSSDPEKVLAGNKQGSAGTKVNRQPIEESDCYTVTAPRRVSMSRSSRASRLARARAAVTGAAGTVVAPQPCVRAKTPTTTPSKPRQLPMPESDDDDETGCDHVIAILLRYQNLARRAVTLDALAAEYDPEHRCDATPMAMVVEAIRRSQPDATRPWLAILRDLLNSSWRIHAKWHFDRRFTISAKFARA